MKPLWDFPSSSARPAWRKASSLVENRVGKSSTTFSAVGGGNRRESMAWITPFLANCRCVSGLGRLEYGTGNVGGVLCLP